MANIGIWGFRKMRLPWVYPDPPGAWAKLPDVIERFVKNELEGKDQWLKGLPADVRAQMEAEVNKAYQERGSTFGFGAVGVAYTTRAWAVDIENQFAARGLVYDPATTTCEAFGEGFEECAMSWKAMLPHYLGIATGAPNIYDMSVSGARFLTQSQFKERIELPNDVCLYLWQYPDGRPIGFYARSQCHIYDPRYVAHVPLEGMTMEVRGLGGGGNLLYPVEGGSLQPEDGLMKMTVYNAIRRGDDGMYYIVGGDISFDDFRERLIQAKIVAE